MKRRTFLKAVPAYTVLAGAAAGIAQNTGTSSSPALEPIKLPPPETDGGISVLAALKARRTNRSVSAKKLPPQMLSNLLWAAFGVNREEGAQTGRIGRTAASASNSQEIGLYVALPEGVYIYEAVPHRLNPVAVGDFRSRSGRRAAATAPVNIFYVADIAKYKEAPFQEPGLKDPEVQKSYYFTATGLIAGNVYFSKFYFRIT